MSAFQINTSDRHALSYWCKKLHCTEYQLREAVSQVGALPSNVEAYLQQRMEGTDHLGPPPGRRPS